MRRIQSKSPVKLLILSWLIASSFHMNLEVAKGIQGQTGKWVIYSNFYKSFYSFSLAWVVLFIGIFVLLSYLRREETENRTSLFVILTALLLAFFVVFGISFEKTNSWSLVFGFENGQFLKALFIFCGHFLLLKELLGKLFRTLDEGGKQFSLGNAFPKVKIVRWYAAHLCDHTLLTVMITLTVFYIILFIASYPGLLMGDSVGLMGQGFPEWGFLRPLYMKETLISENVFYNAHHPIVHALLIHLFLKTGLGIFHSINIGIFLYTLFQFVIVVFSISYTASFLRKDFGIGWKGLALFELYFVCNPIIRNYMFLMTKDVLYSSLFLLFLVSLYRFLGDAYDPKKFAVLFAVSLGMFFFRNDARYSLCLTFLIIAILVKQHRKKMIYSILILVGGSILLSRVIYPFFSITPGSTREMLSVPFQQTARYVKYYGNEVTDEEKSAISAILDYDNLTELYDPDRSDDVKATFHEDASAEDLKNYFTIWASMLRKHPGIYIQATMNNYYMYFYPGEEDIDFYKFQWSEVQYKELSRHIEHSLHQSAYHPEKTEAVRNALAKFRDGYSKLPMINLFMKASLYFWIVIIGLSYAIHSRNRKAFLLLAIFVVSILICCVGPCNGFYGRYIFPFIISLPALMVMLKECYTK